MLSAVERVLSKDDIVIADGLNYIKGFRYQLYCIARAIGTPHCVVWKCKIHSIYVVTVPTMHVHAHAGSVGACGHTDSDGQGVERTEDRWLRRYRV